LPFVYRWWVAPYSSDGGRREWRLVLAATLGMLSAVALLGVAGWLLWTRYTPLAGIAGPGHPVTVSVRRGDVLLLGGAGSANRTAQCTIRPATAAPRTFKVLRTDGEGGGGAEVTAWWTGSAELSCDHPVQGKIGSPHASAIVGGVVVLGLPLIIAAGYFGWLAVSAIRLY
jgi:hypothetical protein